MIALAILWLGMQAPPSFEAASLKLNTSNDPPSADVASGHITARNLPLQRLVQEAWNLRPEQIVGAPNWLANDHYDIAAKAGHDTSVAEVRQMLQALLIERFHMAVHNSEAERSAFVLTVDGSGARLGASQAETPDVLAREGCTPQSTVEPGERGFQCTLSLDRLALSLPLLAPGYFDRTTVNQSGLQGVYQFDLHFVGAAQQGIAPGPSLFDALAKLGLRADTRKVMLPVLVIDRMNRVPTGD